MLQTAAELLISAMAISYISRLSSVKLAATVMGLFFCSSFIAHQIGKETYYMVSLISHENWFANLALVCFLIGIGLILLRKNLTSMAGGID